MQRLGTGQRRCLWRRRRAAMVRTRSSLTPHTPPLCLSCLLTILCVCVVCIWFASLTHSRLQLNSRSVCLLRLALLRLCCAGVPSNRGHPDTPRRGRQAQRSQARRWVREGERQHIVQSLALLLGRSSQLETYAHMFVHHWLLCLLSVAHRLYTALDRGVRGAPAHVPAALARRGESKPGNS